MGYAILRNILLPGLLTSLFLIVLSCNGAASNSTQTAGESNRVISDTVSKNDLNTLVTQSSNLELSVVDGSVARYKVVESLTRFLNPITAIGETTDVSGVIVFQEDGSIHSDSHVTIGTAAFRSDENKRDNWVRRNGGLGDKIFIGITGVEGLDFPIPVSGNFRFKIEGDLTVADITRKTIWNAQADFFADQVVGTASTSVTWEQFGLSQPRLPFIISVSDDIVLEIDFKTIR